MPATAYTFQYTCRLCQQTPLMHYQHREPGATLRATQVKPPLQHYLRQQYGNRPFPADWLNKHGSLNFTLRLVAAEPPRVEEVGPDTPYALFHSNVYTTNTRKAVRGDCLLTVTCFIPSLMGFIKEHLTGFFAVTNFGALKSKGFGSYLPEGATLTPGEVSRLLCARYGAPTCYAFVTPHREELFRQIDTLYRVIKGGIHTPPRRRGLLACYAEEVLGMDTERVLLKEAGVVKLPYRRRHPEGRFLRVLLGMNESYRFDTGKNPQTVGVRHMAETPMSRLPSPLFFKVIGDWVYLVATPLPSAAFDARFRIFNKETKAETVLRTPTRQELGEDFLHRFMAYCAERLSGPQNRLRGLAYMDGIELREVTA